MLYDGHYSNMTCMRQVVYVTFHICQFTFVEILLINCKFGTKSHDEDQLMSIVCGRQLTVIIICAILLLQRTLKKSNQDSCVDELITTEAKYVETLSMLIKVCCYILPFLISLASSRATSVSLYCNQLGLYRFFPNFWRR